MASIETRRNAAGEPTSYRVIWRDAGRRRTQRVPTLEQAQLWARMLEAAGHDTERAAEALKVETSRVPLLRDVCERHLARIGSRTSAYTRRRYRGYVTGHLAELAARPVDEITEEHIAAWVTDRTAAGKSAKTVTNVHGFLHGVMATAVRLGLRQDNPCEHTVLPRPTPARSATFLTAAEFNAIEQHLPAGERPLFRVLVETGLRLGEATALVPTDVDSDGAVPVVRVTRAWKEAEAGVWEVGPPKTPRSVRSVALAPSTKALLDERVKAWAPGELLLSGDVGSKSIPKHRQRLEAWQDAVAAAHEDGSLPVHKRPRIHDLRHTHASLMLGAGMSMHELSRRLGHTSITVTIDRYSHLLPDVHERAAAAVSAAFAS